MHILMYLQTTSFPECFITHNTGIYTFNSMYLLALFYSVLLTECSLLQRKMEVILLFLKQVENIILKVLYHKTRVLYQIPLSTTNVVY